MPLEAVFFLCLLGQAYAGVIRWTADTSQCLSVSGNLVLLGDCGDGEGDNEQFTTTAMGPIHWATHPGRCVFVDVTKGNAITLEDCIDVVNNPAAQFIAMQNGLMCLEDHADKCIRSVGGGHLRALACTPAEKECSFNPVDAIRRYARSSGFVDGSFFNHFSFFNNSDPTHGKVDYVTEATARAEGMMHEADGKVFIGADINSRTGGLGRKSIRIESKAVWREGLFVVSLEHIPTGCGTWPAMWLLGENPDHPWPSWGEYDIIEGTHQDNRVSTTLHTGLGCDQQEGHDADFSGHWAMGIDRKSTNCDVGAPGQYGNQGCGQMGPKGSMGTEFNSQGGGTYAAEWDPEAGYIRTWFWKHGEEPLDVQQGEPDPGRWDQPYSFFRLGDMCPASHFRDMRLIFDLTFCGDLGNPTFATGCPVQAATMTCDELVSNNPEYLQGAFWSIRSLDVYNLQRPNVVRTTEPPLSTLPPVPTTRAPKVQDIVQWTTEAPEVAPPKTVELPSGPLAMPPVPVTVKSVSDASTRQHEDEQKEGEEHEQDSSGHTWLIMFGIVGIVALCVIAAMLIGLISFDELARVDGLHVASPDNDGDPTAEASKTQVRSSSRSRSEVFTSALGEHAAGAASAISTCIANLMQHPLAQQLVAGLESVCHFIVSLWVKYAPQSLQEQCSTGWKAFRGQSDSMWQVCRGQYDSMWQAVAAMDSPDEGGLRKGDQVVVGSPFIAESGTIFGTRLQKNMRGQIEEVHADGAATVQFAGHLGRFPVVIPVELQSNLQVEHTEESSSETKVMTPMQTYRARAVEFCAENKKTVIAFGASTVSLIVIYMFVAHVVSAPPTCTMQYLNCQETLSCCNPTHTCFEKTDQWAACLPDCTPGIHFDEEPQWRSPWTCRVLAPAKTTSTARQLSQAVPQPDLAASAVDGEELDLAYSASTTEYSDRWSKNFSTATSRPPIFVAYGLMAAFAVLFWRWVLSSQTPEDVEQESEETTGPTIVIAE